MSAGYSGTPLPRKLGIKAGHGLALLGAPEGFDETLGLLPENVRVSRDLSQGLDVIVFFTERADDYRTRFPALKTALKPDGGLWIAWPKKASKRATDLTETLIRDHALANGLVDNKVCAIDQTWSGLRLVYRLKDRAGL